MLYTLNPMHYPSISKLVIHAYPTGYPHAYPVYLMGYPLFNQRILQAYPTCYPCLSNRLSNHIQRDMSFIQLDIWSDLWPGHPSPGVPALPSRSTFWHQVLHHLLLQMGRHCALNERGSSVTRVHIPLLVRLRSCTLQRHSPAAAPSVWQPPILLSRQLPASGAPGMGL